MKINRLYMVSWILSFLSLFPGILIAQSSIKVKNTREIYLSFPDSMLKMNILTSVKKVKIYPERMYYWYGMDLLNINRGGYSGNLLHGKYLIYDKGKRLRVDGDYMFGLKNGVWKTWNEYGEYTLIAKWKKGLKEGKSYYFDVNGRLQKVVNYQHDLANGYAIIYRGKSKEKIRYRNGIEIKKVVKSSKKATKPKVSVTPTMDRLTGDTVSKHNSNKGLFGIFTISKRSHKDAVPMDTIRNDRQLKSFAAKKSSSNWVTKFFSKFKRTKSEQSGKPNIKTNAGIKKSATPVKYATPSTSEKK